MTTLALRHPWAPALTLTVALTAALLAAGSALAADRGAIAERRAVADTYADIAQAGYQDALAGAQALQGAVRALIASPSEAAMTAARAAWRAARPAYQQTEAFRFGNAIVDDWEGKVNAWPLDEGLIDYVAPAYGKDSDENPLYAANVIAHPVLKVAGRKLDARRITAKLLAGKLHEAGKVEANVATGYHAIEFLLWGQDLNGTGPGAGKRPWTDYSQTQCTNDPCNRRADFLQAATDLLVDDLAWMAKQWAKGGQARRALERGPADAAVAAILTGMGSLSYGELAGERMKLGLMLHDPEEEHDCFSDNTHVSHYYDALGIRNVYVGEYLRSDGAKIAGASLSSLVAKANPALDTELRAKLDKTVAAMGAIKARAETGEAYDQMIGADNKDGNAVVQAAIDALADQTRSIEAAVAALALKPIALEGSDSLDNPEKVGK